jgi:endonuclease/exonuclease/phosphatase family metal-dependent hydrolase
MCVDVGTRGIALLSRYPINRLKTTYNTNTDVTTTSIYAKVIMGGTQYTVLVTQLNQFPADQENNVISLLGLTHSNSTSDGVGSELDSDSTILLGDFGWSSQSAYVNLAKVYTDSFESVGNGTGLTFPVGNPSIRRDFVYFYAPSKNLVPHESIVEKIPYDPIYISDHYPVSTTFNLTSS